LLPDTVEPEIIIASGIEGCSERYRSFSPGDRVVIVNSPITRYSGIELYLPLLEEKLNDIGILDDDIQILIVYGIH
jgi:lactate racemase